MGLRDVPADAAIRGEATGGGADSSGFLQLRTRDPLLAATELLDPASGTSWWRAVRGSCGAFLAAGLVDELIVYLAPTLLGAGVPALADLGIGTLAQAQHWNWDNGSGGAAVALGRDLRLHLTPAAGTAGTICHAQRGHRRRQLNVYRNHRRAGQAWSPLTAMGRMPAPRWCCTRPAPRWPAWPWAAPSPSTASA